MCGWWWWWLPAEMRRRDRRVETSTFEEFLIAPLEGGGGGSLASTSVFHYANSNLTGLLLLLRSFLCFVVVYGARIQGGGSCECLLESKGLGKKRKNSSFILNCSGTAFVKLHSRILKFYYPPPPLPLPAGCLSRSFYFYFEYLKLLLNEII